MIKEIDKYSTAENQCQMICEIANELAKLNELKKEELKRLESIDNELYKISHTLSKKSSHSKERGEVKE